MNCKYIYAKQNNKTKKKMYYCRLSDDKTNDFERLCHYQRYCIEKNEYVLNHPERCKWNN